jgi:DNA-binding FrmR family transcriptional regulator
MLDLETTKAVRARLNQLARRILAIEHEVESDRHISQLMRQLDEVQLAIGKVGELAFQAHVNNSVNAAIRNGDGRVSSSRVGPLVMSPGRTALKSDVGEST